MTSDKANQMPFIIAEMSGNHNQSLERALKIVDAAADAGADAIKLQTYTADTMTININKNEFFIDDPNCLWYGKSLYELYQEAYTPWEWHEPIFKRAAERGIVAFSTPFDETAVDFLESLNVPMYKISSFENTDLPLIKRVAQTGKPMIISTGMASISDIDDMVRTAKDNGCTDLTLLKCTSAYPADASECNLKTIPHLREMTDCNVGLSDHTLGIGVAIAAVVMGATVIEKHFTLSRSEGGVDSAFSLEPNELKLLVENTRLASKSLGSVSYDLNKSEESSKIFKRSMYVVKDLKKGDTLTRENIKSIRPGYGLSLKYYDSIIGKKIRSDIKAGTPVDWCLI